MYMNFRKKLDYIKAVVEFVAPKLNDINNHFFFKVEN